ncbi:MAG: hypothetical protein WD356_03650 [Pseudomonadales bacterium]
MAIIDESRRLIESNQRFSALVNASPDEQKPGDWIDAAENPALGKAMEVLKNSVCPECVSMELKPVAPDTGPLKATLSRLPGSNSDAELRFLLMVENQPRQRSGNGLAQAATRKAILSRFDHDLRSRLNVISGYCAMVMEDLAEKDDADAMIEDLRCIATAGNELLSLNQKTSDLLGLIQGDWEASLEDILPANILADVIKDIRPKFSLHTFSLEADDSTIRTDAKMLSRLVSSVIFLLCRELSDGCKLRIIAGLNNTLEEDYEITINCTPSAKVAADRVVLENLMEQLRQRTQADSRIPNLDLFYMDTLSEALGARMEADFDPDSGKLGYRINLPVSASDE